MTSSSAIIPVYRGLTLAGNVLERDNAGHVFHYVVTSTTATIDFSPLYVIVERPYSS